jgi:predicted membrane-bound spermidine synthase
MSTRNWVSHLISLGIGVAAGLGFLQTLLRFLPEGHRALTQSYLTSTAIGCTLAFAGTLFCLRFFAQLLVVRSSLPAGVKTRYLRLDALAFLPFLVFNLTAMGVPIPLSSTPVLVLGGCALFQAVLICSLLTAKLSMQTFASFQWLAFLFFLSGFAALIYQIVWQRVLFGLFGVNVESVTITVSLFMFGLGIGSLVGGQLSRRFPAHAPQWFLLCELAIGVFGLFSIPLIEHVGAATLHGSQLSISLATYALLGLPTMGMGATLPILVGYLNRYYANVGKSVGILYFTNTLGSAAACFVTADVLFVLLGLQAAVFVAAAGNFIVALLVFAYCRRTAQKTKETRTTAEEPTLQPLKAPAAPPPDETALSTHHSSLTTHSSLIVALLLAAATGYISLSQEILWFRAISYITAGKPDVFAYVLGFLLFGVALGALIARRVCAAGGRYAMPFIVLMLVLAGIGYELSLPAIAVFLTHYGNTGLIAAYVAVTLIAMLLGSVFPVVCHFGIEGRTSTGFWLSLVYFLNILGATAGPLITGFVLLQVFSLQVNCLILSMATLGLAGILGLVYLPSNQLRLGTLAVVTGALTVITLVHGGLYFQIFEKLNLKKLYHVYAEYQRLYPEYADSLPYKYLLQNRSGVIAVEDRPPADVIYGGGIYDGRFNVDPLLRDELVDPYWSVNVIERAYMMAALHPQPSEVLEIGLSSGSWSRVISDHEAVQHLTVVEINPDYVDLLDKYPESATVKHDPRVDIVVDDGRRWLRRHPDARFDFILMNTSYHWRDHCTNLLSVEFLEICKQHLKPGGVMYYNTTTSNDVIYTAAQVFQYITVYHSFVAASDSAFDMTRDEKAANLLRFVHDGRAVFDPRDPSRRELLISHFLDFDMSDQGPYWRSLPGLWRITDDNMATEYKSIDNGEDRWEYSLANWLFGEREEPRTQ